MKKKEVSLFLAAVISHIFWGFSFLGTKSALGVVHDDLYLLLAHRFLIAFAIMNLLLLIRVVKVDFRGKWKRIYLPLFMGLMEPVEVALMLEDGQVWGTNITLPKHWSDVRVPFADFRYFSHWPVPRFKEGFRLDIRRLDSVCLCFGKWLDPSAAERAHSFAISSIRVE